MSTVISPADEKALNNVVRAFVQEWGVENVIIHVPAKWQAVKEDRHNFSFDQHEPKVVVEVRGGGPKYTAVLSAI